MILIFYPFRTLSSDFTIHFGEILNIQLLQWPESIKLQVNIDLTVWCFLPIIIIVVNEMNTIRSTVYILVPHLAKLRFS